MKELDQSSKSRVEGLAVSSILVPIPTGRDIVVTQVDATDAIIGPVQRRDVFRLGVNFRVVHIFVFNDQGEVLLQHLGPSHRNPGRWGSSVASYVAWGSDYFQAAAESTLRELGSVAPLVPEGTTSMQDLACTKFITLYTARQNGPFTNFDVVEVNRAEFRPADQVSREIAQDATQFTPTFVHVWGFFRRREF